MRVSKIAAIIGLMSALAGCGGGSSSSAPPAPDKGTQLNSPPANTAPVSFTVIDHGPTNAAAYDAPISNAVIRNDVDWAALWRAHQGAGGTRPLPPVDFSKQTVLALFYPQVTSCPVTGVTSVYLQENKLIVEYATRSTQLPDSACTSIAYAAAELVAIDMAADPGLPVVFQKTN